MLTELATYLPILPELIVLVGAMAILMIGVFGPETNEAGERAGWLSILVLIAAGLLIATSDGAATALFDGAFVTNAFTRFMKLLVLGGAAIALMLAFDEFRRYDIMRFEYPVLVLLATAGMMIMVSANDLIALYLGLEMQSLALYVIAAYRRDDVKSSEAGLKYFVLGALASGMLLYGASLIYGFTGSVNFGVIANAAKGADAAQNLWLIFGLVFLLVGLAFKVSAVPFHMWTPDVYEGSATSVTAFFAAAPKVAAMALFTRTMLDAFPGIGPQWQQIVTFIAIASMLLGAFAAIGQTNIKRLMAYSSIANIGFALVGLAANTAAGAQGVAVYMAIYMVMTLGVFACILAMRRDGKAIEDIDELSGLAQTNLPMAVALMILMFSMAGIPPLMGFWAKYYVFLAAVQAGLWPLAIIGVLASVIGVFYYLNIISKMFFADARAPFDAIPSRTYAVMIVAATAMLIGFVALGPFSDAAEAAAKSFRF
ncbi:MAG: NADH-quinone oxidoreductase subunit NuoN [Hyphomicrobiaceae bacterium]